MSWVEVDGVGWSWVEVDGGGWSWVHGLVIPITKYDRYYYKMRQLFYYKMRQKFITKWVKFFITKCDDFITKCNSYYKMRRLLQIAVGHCHYLPTKEEGLFCSACLELFLEVPGHLGLFRLVLACSGLWRIAPDLLYILQTMIL